MLFVSSHFGWVVLLACLVPSLSQGTPREAGARFYGITDECSEELLSCSVPVLMDYLFVTDPEQLLRRVREIELRRHCSQLSKSWNCYRDLIGEDQCSRMNPEIVRYWQTLVDPVATEGWTYVCIKQYNDFNANYRCLLTEEVFTAISTSNCSRAVRPDPDVMKEVSQVADCVSSDIEPICGAKAGDVVKGLILTVARRVVSIIGSQSRGPNGITQDEYDNQLDILKKILWRK